jgi:Tol biopolymer transport system component
MKLRRILAVFVVCLVCLSLIATVACASRRSSAISAPPAVSPTVTPAPQPNPFIAYIHEGNLWIIQIDGRNQKVIAAAPEGATIQDFVWSVDGSRIYFCIGLQLFEVVIESGNVASAGELTNVPGISVDRLEMGRDGRNIIVMALDANATPKLFALKIGERSSRELTIDEYTTIAPQRPAVIRTVGEMSVGPDGLRILYKGLAGMGEELFVADVETGARIQITNLYDLPGFEGSVETEGGRRVIEATWSPDGRYVLFNPMQSCSDIGLCYGRIFLVDSWGGAQLQLSMDMTVNIPQGWANDGRMLVYDDGSKVVVADTSGNPRVLADGHHPKWQPVR